MKFQKLIVAALLAPLLFSTCKKGEDDPFLPLSTRKARVVGDWHISSGSANITYTPKKGSPYSNRYVLKPGDLTMTETYSGGTPTIYVGTYALNVSLKKDGTMVLTENLGNSLVEATGTWDFGSGVGKEKNKSTLVLRINDLSTGTVYSSLFSGLSTICIYHIRELRNKKMVLETENNLDTDANGYGTKFSSNFTIVQ